MVRVADAGGRIPVELPAIVQSDYVSIIFEFPKHRSTVEMLRNGANPSEP